MFRITKIFENDLIFIYKSEGKITEENLGDWTDEIRLLIKQSDRQIILEMCQFTFVSPKAVRSLIELITKDVFLLNSPTFIKNTLHCAGLSANVLD